MNMLAVLGPELHRMIRVSVSGRSIVWERARDLKPRRALSPFGSTLKGPERERRKKLKNISKASKRRNRGK